jgi:hypothetical protein
MLSWLPDTGIKTFPVRRETGKWLQMRVLYVEDLANHADPESCVGIRKDDGEALTGEHAGRVLSRGCGSVCGGSAGVASAEDPDHRIRAPRGAQAQGSKPVMPSANSEAPAT